MLVLYFTYIDDEQKKNKFAEIYHAYRKQMFFVAKAVTHNDADAEDVVHEVFLNIAMRHMPTIDGIENEKVLRNYLLTSTRHTALNWMRRYKHIEYVESESDIDNSMLDIADNRFVDEICQRMEYEQVIKAVQTLEEKYRNVIYYHFVLEIPVPKVAELLQQSLAATKKQLVRGKKKLLARLEMEGGEKHVNE